MVPNYSLYPYNVLSCISERFCFNFEQINIPPRPAPSSFLDRIFSQHQLIESNANYLSRFQNKARITIFSIANIQTKALQVHSGPHFLTCGYYQLYKHTDDGTFDDFPKISDHVPKIYEDFSKLFRRPDEHSRKFSQNFRRCPKIAEDFRGRPEDVSMIHQRI